jgi:TrmH family RNA methyltransferase
MDVRVVFVEPESGGNIGSVARLMKNFGISEFYLVNPKAHIGKEAWALAAHAQDILENIIIVKQLKEALNDIDYVVGTTAIVAKSSSNLLRASVSARDFTQNVEKVKGKVALLLGRESTGLSNTELTCCDVVVTIPSDSTYKTLNVASASAIIFYEMWMAKLHFKYKQTKEMSREHRERLLQLFNDICKILNLPIHKERLIQRAFKNIISRALISTRETTLLIGIFRKLYQRLSVGKSG